MRSITVKITGVKEIEAKLTILGDQLFKLKPEMEEVGDELIKYYQDDVFRSQGGVLGFPWKETQLRSKRTKLPIVSVGNSATSTLIRSGTMRDSFYRKAKNTSVTIGNSTDYFKYHQSSAPRTKMPYRPMMGINKPVRSIIQQIIEKGIRDKIDGVGL